MSVSSYHNARNPRLYHPTSHTVYRTAADILDGERAVLLNQKPSYPA